MSSAVIRQSYAVRQPSRALLANAGAAQIDWIVIVVLGVHPLIALLMSSSKLVSTAHGVVVGIVALFFTLRSRKHPEYVAYAGAYIVGAEVLWRMTGSMLFWEFGKYMTAAIFLVSLVLNSHRRILVAPWIYFALLMPSTFLTIQNASEFQQLHRSLSFYLSGPLALAMAWSFFAQVKLSSRQLHRVFLSLIGPTLGVATIGLFATLTAKRLAFTDESNFVTSGGFGPNQVSGALALGMLCAVIWLIGNTGGWMERGLVFLVLAILGTQAVLTFSRGGIYNAIGASLVAAYFLLRDRRSRLRVIAATFVILLVTVFVVVPRLEAFTGGAMSTRFKNVDVANRDSIMRSDLELWQENPVLGVGPGMAAVSRRMPHTEFTRLLSEHGLFGLGAIIVLLISCITAVRKGRGATGKALAGSMVTFSVLFMLDKALRLVAPCFAFGLAFATLSSDGRTNKAPLSGSAQQKKRPLLFAGQPVLRPRRFPRRLPIS